MARSKRTLEEQLEDLEDFQKEYLQGELRRMKGRLPPAAPPAPPSPPPGPGTAGAIGSRLKSAWDYLTDLPSKAGEAWDYWTSSPYRIPEFTSAALATAAWPVTKAAELQPFSSRLQDAGRQVQNLLDMTSQAWAAKAGTKPEEYEKPMLPGFVGALRWPWPKLTPASRFLSPESAVNLGKGLGAGMAYGLAAETDRPPAERDYTAGGTIGGAIGGAAQVLAGRFAGRGMPDPSKSKSGVVFPEDDIVSVPEVVVRPRPKQPGPVPQMPDYVDVPWSDVPPADLPPGPPAPGAVDSPIGTLPQLEQRSLTDPIYQPGPLKTGPGTVIELPGPVYKSPPEIADILARLEVEAKPEPTVRELLDMIPKELDVSDVDRLIRHPERRPNLWEHRQPDTMEIAELPRHKLPQDVQSDLLDRVQYARDTMEIAGQERGFKNFIEVPGQGGTPDVISGESPTPDWYKFLTHGPGKLSRQQIDTALGKIERDAGEDVGPAVERVKHALLQEPEFNDWKRAHENLSNFDWDAIAADVEALDHEDVRWPEPPSFEGEISEVHEQAGLYGQQEIPVPPETVHARPLIGREVTPEEAPLFSEQAKTPEPTQAPLFHEEPAAGKNEALRRDSLEAQQEVREELAVEEDGLKRLWNVLNNEKGQVILGGGVGPIERLLTQRRFAERHPRDFGPVYETATQRGEFVATQKSDLRQLAADYFKFKKEHPDQALKLDELLRERRRRGGAVQIPQHMQAAVNAVDRMMQSAWQLVNDVRATKNLPPIPQDPYYVPFSRSGDYLTILDAPGVPRYVTASKTLREAEQVAEQLKAKYGVDPLVKQASGKKGDQPALDFGTLSLLEKAGLLTPDEYEEAIRKFDLPPGFAGHFRQAAKVLGEAEDLTGPIERYIDTLANYTGRFLYDDVMKGQIQKIQDPNVRQYAERYREYLNHKPQEYSRLRGAVAVWDLALNVGSMMQNASQVPVMGYPVLHRAVGDAKEAGRLFSEGWKALARPSAQDLNILARAEREGHIRPINAEELFGTIDHETLGVEFGSPYIQRLGERGALTPQVVRMLRHPIDLTAGLVETGWEKAHAANRKAGEKVSYALHRLTGDTPQIATDKASRAHGILMQGFSAIEEMNRKWAILTGYRAGKHLGLQDAEAFEYAKKFSRDVNFDYSPASRAELFRGPTAPLGLFMTFQTEALSTYSKLAREALKGKVGPAASAAIAFWTLAGLKGLPAVDDLDTYGPRPGAFSENLPDWLYHGPASAVTGRDISSKFKIGPRVPYDLLRDQWDFSQIPVAQPFAQVGQTADWFLKSPMDAPSTQIAIERMLPPSLRHLATAGRWAGLGPAGDIEQGAVGTIRGHTPGPTAEGKKDFFRPGSFDIAAKAFSYTPLELSKQYQRGRIEQVGRERHKDAISQLVHDVANELDRNGLGVETDKIRELREKHPRIWSGLVKAHNLRRAGEKASTYQIYRRGQEPKPKKGAGNGHSDVDSSGR